MENWSDFAIPGDPFGHRFGDCSWLIVVGFYLFSRNV
jgi:hypothetical protein